MKKTFRIGDLVCYDDYFVKERNLEDDGQFVGTIVGWSKASDGSTRAKAVSYTHLRAHET